MGRTARTVTVSLPPELARKVDKLARKEGRTRSELFRAAILQYMQRLERWEKIFEYGEQRARELGITEEDVLESIMEDRRKWRKWKAPKQSST
jgi:predicted transcriptional regulator